MIFAGKCIKDDILKMGTIFNWENAYFTMDEVSDLAKCFSFQMNELVIIARFHTASIFCSDGSIHSIV